MNIFKTACIVLLTPLFSLKNLNAQEINPKKYETSLHKELIFEDNFDDDKNKWIEKDDSDEDDKPDTAYVDSKDTKIANGHLKYDNQSKSKIYATNINTNIDFNKNFQIEISALIFFTYKSSQPVAVTFWGRDSAYNCNYLYNDGYNYFIFIDCKDYKDCTSKSKRSKAFIKDDFNKITIRHYNDFYYIFINEKFLKAFPFRPLKGNRIGLGAGIQCTMVYDYIKIHYLDSFLLSPNKPKL